MSALDTGCPFGFAAGTRGPDQHQGGAIGNGTGERRARSDRPRNFLREPCEGERHRAPTDGEALRATQKRLKRLSYMMTATPGRPEAERESGIPSGYAYMLQFAVHDMVNIEPSVLDAEADPARGGRVLINKRARQLRLDTLYGCASAGRHLDPVDGRLRIGRMAVPPDREAGAPFRDIPRGDSKEPPFAAPEIADTANDRHVILSQLTVLFSLLHNAFVRVQKEGDAAKRFQAARRATASVYRRMLREEVLPAVLHPKVRDLYKEGVRLRTDGAGGVPLEFSHAAMRFGHSMVRSRYQLNSGPGGARQPHRITDLMRRTSERGRTGYVPLTADWLVSWSRFFRIEGHAQHEMAKPNLARPIGPSIVNSLAAESLFRRKAPDSPMALVYADLLSSALAGLWSVPALIAEICRRNGELGVLLLGGEGLQGPRERLEGRIRGWLMGRRERFGLTEADVEALARDPPMYFYVLLESELAGLEAPEADRGRLGPLGSIIVAEVMFGLLERDPDREFDPETLPVELRSCVDGIQSMESLIRFAEEHRERPDAADLRIDEPHFV